MDRLIKLFVLGVEGFNINIMGINALFMGIVKVMERLIIKLHKKSLLNNLSMISIRLRPVRKGIDIKIVVICIFMPINKIYILRDIIKRAEFYIL